MSRQGPIRLWPALARNRCDSDERTATLQNRFGYAYEGALNAE